MWRRFILVLLDFLYGKTFTFPFSTINLDVLICFFWILVDLSFLLYRIPFEGFLQRYGLIAKYSHFKSGSHCVGKYSLLQDPFKINFGSFTVDKE